MKIIRLLCVVRPRCLVYLHSLRFCVMCVVNVFPPRFLRRIVSAVSALVALSASVSLLWCKSRYDQIQFSVLCVVTYPPTLQVSAQMDELQKLRSTCDCESQIVTTCAACL